MHLDISDVPAWGALILSIGAVWVSILATRHAKTSANASRRSADAAELQGKAAVLAARIANATTVVEFDAEYVWQPPLMFLTIAPKGANIEVLRVEGHFGKHDVAGIRTAVDEVLFESSPPHVLEGKSRMQYTWDSPKIFPEIGDKGHSACALIVYRLAEGAPERSAWVGADMSLPEGFAPVPMPPSQTSTVRGK